MTSLIGRKKPSKSPGWTLVELLVVLVLLSLLVGLSIPHLRFWRERFLLESASSQLESLIRFGQTQAILEARPYRMDIDPEKGIYRLERASKEKRRQFEALPGRLGRTQSLPLGVSFGPRTSRKVLFFPDGSSNRPEIILSSKQRELTLRAPHAFSSIQVKLS